MPNESKKEVEQRVLEAEKVVVSNILHNWRKRYNMGYSLVVWNGPGDVFSRTRTGPESALEMMNVMEKELTSLKPGLMAQLKLQAFSCGYCKFEGLVSETPNWTCCPNCGAV